MKFHIPYFHNNPVWAKTYRRIEMFFKNIVCIRDTKNFWCDSRFHLCYACGALRMMIRTGTLYNPNKRMCTIYTRQNTYICDGIHKDIIMMDRQKYPLGQMPPKDGPQAMQLMEGIT